MDVIDVFNIWCPSVEVTLLPFQGEDANKVPNVLPYTIT